MQTNQIIGKNIAYLRGNMQLTQADLATYLDENRVEISYYENGQRTIPMEKLDRLAELFGVETDDFYDENLPHSTTSRAVYAFRSAGLKAEDLKGIADFRRIVKNYLKMKRLEKKL